MFRKALDGPAFRCGDGVWHSFEEHAGSRSNDNDPFPPWKEASPADPAMGREKIHPWRDA